MKNLGDLPDDVFMKILSLLPTEEAAATSVLLKQWSCLWKQEDVNYVELCDECSAYWKARIYTGPGNQSTHRCPCDRFVCLMSLIERQAYLKVCAECKGRIHARKKVTVFVLGQESGKTDAFIWTKDKHGIRVEYVVRGMMVSQAYKKLAVAN
ncbi:F-box domain-containing protein [Raphanus sativus]|nr:F-box domain-containing protein [Raphanus sativus]